MRHPYFELPRPIVFGHRGASGERPENTLEAFALAVQQGADIVETDVHLSRDGQVVVFHDAELERTTDGHGPLAALELAELRALDAGHGFTPDAGGSFPFRGRGLQIPTLPEVFEALPGIRLNIELKRNDPRLVDAVLDLVEQTKRAELVLLAAEADDTMQALRARRRERGVPTALGASVADVLGFVRAALGEGDPPAEPMALQIPAEFAGRPLVTPELVSFAHGQDVQIHVWTINDEDEMRRLLDLDVDGLMSDFPARLSAVVEAWRGSG